MNLSIKDYIKQLTALYQTAFALSRSKQEQPFYRIVKLPDELEEKIYFQVVGTANVLKMLPEEIMRNDLLLGFSRVDIALITHLGTKNEVTAFSQQASKEGSKFFKVLKQIFTRGKTSFVFEKDTGEVMECEAHELYTDESVADRFSGKDAMKIGYSAAESHYQKISELKSLHETN